MKILVVEDEEQIALFIKKVLEKEGFELTLCESPSKAIKAKHHLSHDLIILDLMLKEERGEEMVRTIRGNGSKTPILVLSALSQIQTKIDLINMGADDYMVKPFHAEELVARINALYRRYLANVGENDGLDKSNGVTFNWKQNTIEHKNQLVQLTKKETEVLKVLAAHEGNTVSTEALHAQVWGGKMGYQSNVVQSTLRRLRSKLDKTEVGVRITTIHGIGYQMIISN